MTTRRHLLHNMSQPPKTQVVIAPHRPTRPAGLVLSLSRDTWRAARRTLAESATSDRTLDEHTRDRLRALGVPEVAVVRSCERRATEPVDPILALAVFSRCTGSLFLLRRTARLDFPPPGHRCLCVLDPALAELLRTCTWT